MKRLIGFCVILMLLAGTVLAAQYTVLPGDTGWELAQEYYRDATKWQRVVDANPFLKTPGRVFEKNGRIILILKPGERLEGLEWMDMEAPIAVPISELGLMAPAPKVQVVEAPSTIPDWLFWIFWVALTATIVFLVIGWANRQRRMMLADEVAHEETERRVREDAIAAARARAYYEREQELNSDPVTSGVAYIPGGIPPTEPERLREFFTAQAVSSYAERTGQDQNMIRVQQVGPIESGTIRGEGEVGYLDDRGFRPRRIAEPGIAAYQGRFRLPDGTEVVLQTLQGCMNPVRSGYGDVYRGFTFTPGAIVVPAPEPTTTTPTATTPEPTPVEETSNIVSLPNVVPSTEVARTEEGMVKIELRKQTPDQPAMVRLSGVDVDSDTTVEVGKDTIQVRFYPRG